MKKLAVTGDSGGPMAVSSSLCSQNWPLKQKNEEVRMWWISLTLSSSNCQLRIGTLVKSSTVSMLTRMSFRLTWRVSSVHG
jgi:hypothetical protein